MSAFFKNDKIELYYARENGAKVTLFVSAASVVIVNNSYISFNDVD